jgi:hypothetical protein
MNITRFALVLTLGLTLGFAPRPASAADGEKAKPREVTLKVRQGNGPYGDAAYSFRQTTQDVAVHRNYVDLVLNGCGQLHVSPVNGSKSEICDLGAAELGNAADEAPVDAKWLAESISPQAGHVYLLQVDANEQHMTVKFRVNEVTADAVKLTWVTVKPLEGPAPNPRRGAAGTMGQCGGKHDSK